MPDAAPPRSSRSTCRSRRSSRRSLDAGEWGPGTAIPSEAILARALRSLAGHRAQGDRRARRRKPRRAAAGQGHVRRDAHRGSVVALPLPADSPQRRRRRVSGKPRASTCGAARRPPRRRACSTSSRAMPILLVRGSSNTRASPSMLDEITLPGALFRGTHQGAGRRLPRLDVRPFRDAVRRPDGQGAGKAPRRCRRRRKREDSRRASRAIRCSRSIGSRSPTATGPSNGGAAFARRSDITTSTRSADRCRRWHSRRTQRVRWPKAPASRYNLVVAMHKRRQCRIAAARLEGPVPLFSRFPPCPVSGLDT